MEAKPVKQMYGAVLDTEESFVKVSPIKKHIFQSDVKPKFVSS